MCVKNTHFKCLKSYYRDSRVKVTHLFLECGDHFDVSVLNLTSKSVVLKYFRKNSSAVYANILK